MNKHTIIGRGYKSKAIQCVNIRIKKSLLDELQPDEYGNYRLTMFVNDLPPKPDGKTDCDYVIKADSRYQEPIL